MLTSLLFGNHFQLLSRDQICFLFKLPKGNNSSRHSDSSSNSCHSCRDGSSVSSCYSGGNDTIESISKLICLSIQIFQLSNSFTKNEYAQHWLTNFMHWMVSYLSRRHEYVQIDDMTSQSLNVQFGMPQGFILGSLIFNIYITDLHLSLAPNTYCIQYADNTTIYVHLEMLINSSLLLLLLLSLACASLLHVRSADLRSCTHLLTQTLVSGRPRTPTE